MMNALTNMKHILKKQTNKQRKRIKRGRVLLWDHPDTIYTKTVGMKFLSVMLVMLLVTF